MTAPAEFRKLPVTITAVQWDGTAAGATPIVDWILTGGGTATYHCAHDMGCSGTLHGHTISIRTLEGAMQASPRDWIIRGLVGEFYPCRDDIFSATYEAV